MKKKIFLSYIAILLATVLYASENIKLYFQNDTLGNAQTALLFLEANNIKEPKLTFEKLNINFLPNKNKENSYFALIPINYYTKPDKYKIIVSYIQNGKKEFKALFLNVVDANYKSETLSVQPSKVKPNKKDQARASKEYKEAIEIYKNSSPNLQTTSFIHPMNSKITSAFGNKRVYNGELKSFHSGTDYRAMIGTPIYSTASGVVKLARDRFYAGKSVIVDHGYGVYSMYAHLNDIKVKEGDIVSQKDLLGYSGNTGRITGPHLHFGIRVHNTLVDPVQFINTINSLN